MAAEVIQVIGRDGQIERDSGLGVAQAAFGHAMLSTDERLTVLAEMFEADGLFMDQDMLVCPLNVGTAKPYSDLLRVLMDDPKLSGRTEFSWNGERRAFDEVFFKYDDQPRLVKQIQEQAGSVDEKDGFERRVLDDSFPILVVTNGRGQATLGGNYGDRSLSVQCGAYEVRHDKGRTNIQTHVASQDFAQATTLAAAPEKSHITQITITQNPEIVRKTGSWDHVNLVLPVQHADSVQGFYRSLPEGWDTKRQNCAIAGRPVKHLI